MQTTTAAAPNRDVFLNLDDDVPPAFAELAGRFERLIEVVSRDGDDRLRARDRFKRYREAGITPNTFEMGHE